MKNKNIKLPKVPSKLIRLALKELDIVDEVMLKSDGYTPAQMQELCTSVALQNYWK